MLTIMQQDILTLLKNKQIMIYLVLNTSLVVSSAMMF